MLTKEFCLDYCKKQGLSLSPHAEKLIEMVNQNDGNCPCNPNRLNCPCDKHLDDLKESGRCYCGLFLKA